MLIILGDSLKAGKSGVGMVKKNLRFAIFENMRFAIFASVLIYAVSPILHAQSFLNYAPKNNQPAQPQPSGQPLNRVMSPDAFQNATKNLGQQNLNNLSTQAIQELQKTMPTPTVKPPGSGSPLPDVIQA